MRLTFHRDVAADLIRMITHYEDLGGSNLAKEFQIEVRATFLRALEAPRRYQVFKRDLRRANCPGFPTTVCFGSSATT